MDSKTKSGFLTSEFWTSVLGIVSLVASFFWGKLSPELAAKLTVIIVAVFVMARTIVKMTSTMKDDEILALVKCLLDKVGIKVPDETTSSSSASSISGDKAGS